jgi:hypothetical protein
MFGILSITVIYNNGAKELKGDNFQGGKGYKDSDDLVKFQC